MKVTALIPDSIVKEVQKYAGGKTLTESLILALKEWLSFKKIKKLNQKIEVLSDLVTAYLTSPLTFYTTID